MMAVTEAHEWFCMQCAGGTTFHFPNGTPRRYPTPEDVCPYCGGKNRWRRGGDPLIPWELNENDRRMLKAFRIVQE